jgi:outer membrane protein OmpA-like peptidoglycan-associated protein
MAKTALAQDKVASPYQQVLDFVPQALSVGLDRNKPLPQWRWGSITPAFIPKVDAWIRHYAGTKLDELPDKVPEIVIIPDVPLPTILRPRAQVRSIVGDLKKDPVKTLGKIIHWPASPSLAGGEPMPPVEGDCAVPPVPQPPPAPDPKHHVVTLPEEVLHFKFDSATVESEDKTRAIAELEKELGPGLAKADLTKPVEVRGHTDSIGSAAYNQGLSERRAEAVKAILEDRYPTLKGHVQTHGYGATRPVADNRKNGHDNPEGRRLNRRVEVVVQTDVPDN